MTATRQPARIGSSGAMAAMHRAAHAICELHAEMVAGTEAVVRSAAVLGPARHGPSSQKLPADSARPARRS
jgi:hypothetical protein